MKTYKVTLAIESEVEVEVEIDDDAPQDDESIIQIARELWEANGAGTKTQRKYVPSFLEVTCAALEEC